MECTTTTSFIGIGRAAGRSAGWWDHKEKGDAMRHGAFGGRGYRRKLVQSAAFAESWVLVPYLFSFEPVVAPLAYGRP